MEIEFKALSANNEIEDELIREYVSSNPYSTIIDLEETYIQVACFAIVD